ncbi:MAG: efflux RND transporter periplasmic adaptor subunit [Sporomusaceae bacterium]|nr:efflux RND transporter periplasmic adaptor subunit [Sporomusaceae bacterium]
MATDKKRLIRIVAVVAIVFTAIIAFRIYTNLAANKERAGRVTQGRAVAVVVSAVGRHDIQPVLSFSANLEPSWTADLSPKVDGRLAVLYADEGDKVKAGTVVATLDTDELAPLVSTAEGTVYEKRANLEQAELDLKRAIPLAQQGAISAQALDTARIKRDLAIGQLRAAEGALTQLRARLGNANIVAPRDGVITKRYLQAGYYAKTGSPVVSLADTSSMLVKASVGEAEISQLKIGSSATVRVTALGNREIGGKVTRLTPAASLPIRTFTAEVTVPNAEGVLLAGMFARVEVAGDVRRNVVAVPESALVLREDQKAVYAVLDDNKVQLRILKLGYVGGGWAEVLDGLKEGEQIVTGGQNKLRDGATIERAGGKGE